VLIGDYARVLYKLSEVLASSDGDKLEADSMRSEARSILLARKEVSTVSEIDDGEKSYDSLVYILWR
jgi:hypothetical protein